MEDSTWQKAQSWEGQWHDKVSTNSYHEEEKQFEYAKKMGIEIYADAYTPYNIKLNGRTLDIGGGDTSMLLKTEFTEGSVVVDPCGYPNWALQRYASRSIEFFNRKAEDLTKFIEGPFEECWIYNCLQHVEDPEKIIQNAKKVSKLIRIFEWIDAGVNVGHIHNLTEKDLNEWLGGEGKVGDIAEHGCYGRYYVGIFKGDIN